MTPEDLDDVVKMIFQRKKADPARKTLMTIGTPDMEHRVREWMQLKQGATIFLVDDKGNHWGIQTPRTPRKLKKKLKKAGIYAGPKITGIPINKILQ